VRRSATDSELSAEYLPAVGVIRKDLHAFARGTFGDGLENGLKNELSAMRMCEGRTGRVRRGDQRSS
jgi:hypothetical protein